MMPIEELTKQIPLPGAFLRFVGGAEVLGAVGLVLPGMLRVGKILTPLAASGLVTIMAGATTVTIMEQGSAPALMPLFVGLLTACVVRGRYPL